MALNLFFFFYLLVLHFKADLFLTDPVQHALVKLACPLLGRHDPFGPHLPDLSDGLQDLQGESLIVFVERFLIDLDLESPFNDLDCELFEILHSLIYFLDDFILLEFASNQHCDSILGYRVGHFHIVDSAFQHLN